jgi:hypothetical protein
MFLRFPWKARVPASRRVRTDLPYGRWVFQNHQKSLQLEDFLSLLESVPVVVVVVALPLRAPLWVSPAWRVLALAAIAFAPCVSRVWGSQANPLAR